MARESELAATTDAAMPPTSKGRATRKRIEDALRQLLTTSPYCAIRIADIAEGAKLSPGAVYRYFSDRRQILLTVLRELTDEAYTFAHAPWDPSDPAKSVRETTVLYLKFYEQNRALFAVMAELAQSDDDVRAIWLHSQQEFHRRIEHALARGAEQGVVRNDIDLTLAAELLGGMTEFYAYRRFVVGFADPSHDAMAVADALTALWSSGAFPKHPARSRK